MEVIFDDRHFRKSTENMHTSTLKHLQHAKYDCLDFLFYFFAAQYYFILYPMPHILQIDYPSPLIPQLSESAFPARLLFRHQKVRSKAALEQLNGKIQRNVIILLLKPFSPRMPQNPRQPSAHSAYTAKREFHSLKYKEISPNTPPFYAIPSLNASLHRDKFKKDTQKQSDSFETCESEGASHTERNNYHGRENKIKVELCKNFVEKGYCPYENRCKFAHGIEELRAKDTWGNSQLYRTRKCKVFYEKHECKFGERCNFMHENRKIGQIMTVNNKALRQAIRMNFQQISFEGYTARVQSSRLMGLLQGDEADNNI